MIRNGLGTLALYLLVACSATTAYAQNGPYGLDYDRDGVDDQVIYRPNLGLWAIKSSFDPTTVLLRQWGLRNDHPIVGDYTGDGIADLVVWRPSNGNWYICKSDTNFDCFGTNGNIAFQFGLEDDKPIKADFDDDGILDLAVWRPQFGLFIYRSSATGDAVVSQWGLPNDIPMQTSPNR